MLNGKSFLYKKKVLNTKSRLHQVETKTILLEELIIQNRTLHNWLFLAVLFLMFVPILFLNIKTPFIGDDFVYSFVYQTQDRLSSMKDVFYSQYRHYYMWGGRSVVHFITQTLLLTDNSLLIDVVNSLGFIAFILVIHYHIIGKFNHSISTLIVSFALTWLIQPVFAETVLWITGSSNYLWGTLIILLFLLPYRFYQGRQLSLFKNVVVSILMLLGGIIAGWTNENTAAAMLVMIVAFILYTKLKGQNTSPWMYLGLLGAIIGYILMIAAPGNLARAEGASISPFLVVYRTLNYTQRFVNYLGLLNLAMALLMIAYLKTHSTNKKELLVNLLIYFVGLFVSIYIMIASPTFPGRAWFGSITFNIIAFGALYYSMGNSEGIIKRMKYCFLLFCLISFAASFYDAYKDVTNISDIWKERMVVIAEKKQQHETTVIFKEYQAKTKYGLGDASYALPYISLYYGIDFELEE